MKKNYGFTFHACFRFFIRNLIALIFLFQFSIVNGQEADSVITSPEPKKSFKLPIISVAAGVLNFSGDLGYQRLDQPLTAKTGFQIELQPYTENRFAFSLFYLTGNVFGEEKTFERALNFSTSIMSGGLLFRYDFINRKREDQILIPFLTLGAEYLQFTPSIDLKDANGKNYNYWTDGTIRDIAQNDNNADQSVRIYRDYTYETDLGEANLDGFGKFKTNTWGIPVGAGVRFKISNRCSMHLSSVCHFTQTDYIDGITAESKGNRQGNVRNDKIFYTSASFRFSLSSNNDQSGVDLNALVNEDADGDGIPDISDDSSGTPLNNEVNLDGKPLDKDNDGIPDYRDLELNSASDAVVNEQGITITEEMIEEKFRKDSLAALPAVIEYLQSYDKLTKRNPDVEKKWLEKNAAAGSASGVNPIPPIYRVLDTDLNTIITPKEISKAIDDYLARRSSYSVSEFFDLIDFFFTQD